MTNDLASNVAKKFPLAEFKEAIAAYKENMSAGKVLFCPSLIESVNIAPSA